MESTQNTKRVLNITRAAEECHGERITRSKRRGGFKNKREKVEVTALIFKSQKLETKGGKEMGLFVLEKGWKGLSVLVLSVSSFSHLKFGSLPCCSNLLF